MSAPTLRSLVEELLGMAAGEREPWLRTRIPHDEAQIREALEIVKRAEEDDAFLVPGSPTPARALGAGVRLHHFHILREIGRGGMGRVYEARQDVPRRRVALKVLHASMAHASARDRFRYEVEVLGALRHPHIAQLIEAGIEEDGAAYGWMAMEFVEGGTSLRDYVAQAADPRASGLSLFLKVCEGVQHGHAQGVVHRDLKPDNLLVDPQGHVKIIDFGIARVLDASGWDATLRTRAEEIAGTLAYMSPEQVRGARVDTRADVYALGVVLYELLTGGRPIEPPSGDLLAAARHIADTPPRPPSRWDPGLRGDLEAIVLRCLEKDPDRRYASAAALAADVRHHLDGERVTARTPTLSYHVRLFARRHKVLLATMMVLATTLIAATAVSIGFSLRADREARAAERERDRFQHLWKTQFQQSMEDVGRHAEDLMGTLGGAPIAQRMLGAAIERLQGLEPDATGEAEILRGLARAYAALGRATTYTGPLSPELASEIQSALDHAERLYGVARATSGDDPQLHNEWAAVVLRRLTHHAVFANEIPTSSIDAARQILADGRTRPDVQVMARWALAEVAAVRGEHAHCRDLLSDAIDQAEAAGTPAFDVASLIRFRGDARLRAGDRRGALVDHEEARDRLLPLAKARPEHVMVQSGLARAHYIVGNTLMSLGRPQDARKAFEHAQAQARALQMRAPGHLRTLMSQVGALRGLGQIETSDAVANHPKGSPARRQGILRAIAHWEDARDIVQRILDTGQPAAHLQRSRRTLETMIQMNRRALGNSGTHVPGD